MTAASIIDWDTALHDATYAVRAAKPIDDLASLRDGAALSLRAAYAAELRSIDEGLRWAAIVESILAVTDDLSRVLNPAVGQAKQPAPEFGWNSTTPENPFVGTDANIAALRRLWTVIIDRLDAYSNHHAVLAAAISARSVHQLLGIHAQAPG